jgi:site-specific DNA-methyltransferase (adenine-specific)
MNKFISEVTNEDCMEGMARYPDKYFDLAIVDPPYGIGESNKQRKNTPSKKWKSAKNNIQYIKKEWDYGIPKKEYFNELKRVSKNQIIWGGNYMTEFLPPKMGWIFWDKKTGDSDFSDGELAWTSFDKGLRKFEWLWSGFKKKQLEERTHPTQKPVALYKWLLSNYAKQGDKILDTHLGSGSSRIAAYEMGYDFTAFELDTEYFETQEKRYKAHIAQLKLELI